MSAPSTTTPTAAELEQLVQPDAPSLEALEGELRQHIEAEVRAEYQARIRELEAEVLTVAAELDAERDRDRCVSIREGAMKLGVSHTTLYEKRSELPFIVDVAGSPRVFLKALDTYREGGGRPRQHQSPAPTSLATVEARSRRRSSRRYK